jgi:hypothetical protein
MKTLDLLFLIPFLVIGMLLLFVISEIIYDIYKNNQINKNNCLIEIAQEYCSEKSLIYVKTYSVFNLFKTEIGFYCREDRQKTRQEFLFKIEEIEACGFE